MGEGIHPRVQKLAEGPVWKHLKVEVLSAKDHMAKVQLPVTEELKQVYGVLHGGIVATLLDMSMGAAFSTSITEEEYGSTTDFHVNYLRPMFGEWLIAEAKIVKRGKRLVVLSAEAMNEDGEVIALCTGQFMVLKR